MTGNSKTEFYDIRLMEITLDFTTQARATVKITQAKTVKEKTKCKTFIFTGHGFNHYEATLQAIKNAADRIVFGPYSRVVPCA